MNTRDLNETLRSLNVGLPDDVERLKAAGYYEEAIARIDAYLAEDWTKTQNSPYSQGLCPHMDVQPENPTPHGVDVLRDAMIAQREIMRRIPAEYTWSKADAIAEMQRRVKDFTPEEFEMLDRENRMALRAGGEVICLTRPPELLAREGRPLSLDLAALEKDREPIYALCRDFCIANDKSVEQTVERIRNR